MSVNWWLRAREQFLERFIAIWRPKLKSRPGLESRPGQQQNGKGLRLEGKRKAFKAHLGFAWIKKNVSDMELDMVADMEVDKVADMVADINIIIEIQFGERVG